MAKKNIQVEITRGFDEDEQSLSKELRDKLTESLNNLVMTARGISFPRKLYKPVGVHLPQNVKKEDSSLYVFKATTRLSVVLAYDDDPIFRRKLLTLYRVVSSQQIIEAFDEIALKLYR